MKKTFKQTMAGLFSTAEGTFYKWKREQRPIISLLEKYFTKEDLEEFLETGAVARYELDAIQPKNENTPLKEPVRSKFGKDYKVAASAVLDCTLASYYNWAKESRPVISLFEQYFTKSELEEFLRTGGIEKMEIVAGLSLEDLKLIRENKEVIIKFQEIKQLLQGTNNV